MKPIFAICVAFNEEMLVALRGEITALLAFRSADLDSESAESTRLVRPCRASGGTSSSVWVLQ